MGVAIASGLWLYYNVDWAEPGLFQVKWTLITIALVVVGVHQVFARRLSPALRGITQLVILVLAVGIFAAAVALPG
jgi:hypothetical protein